MKKLLICFMISTITFQSFAEDVPGQNLLSYFQSNCRTQGEWTRAAIADSAALIEALRKIQDDEDCRSVGGAVAQLGLLQQQLTLLDQTNSTRVKIAELNAQEQELLVQLSGTQDRDTITEINTNLRSIQLTRAGIMGQEQAQKEMSSADKVESLAGIIQIANTAFNQITGNQKCMGKNPNLLNTATTIMASVGATAAVVNPALGLGLTAGSAFLGQTVEGIRRSMSARQIRRISDSSIALEGYKCALETMSERWCQMRDAESFLLFKARQRKLPRVGNTLGTAIRLNDREIPVLIDWLNKIRNGVTPTTTSEADRQNNVLFRENYIRSFANSGNGQIEQTRPLYNSSSDLKDKRTIIRSLVGSLIPGQSNGWKNPLLEIITPSYAPFYLLGLEDTAAIKNPATGGYFTLDDWPGFSNYNPDIDLVKSRFSEWIAAARKRVNVELTQVLQPDALQTLSSAFDRSGNPWKMSPMDSMKNLTEFLVKNPPQESDIAFQKLYQSTIEKLQEMYRITYDAIIKDDLEAIDGDTTVVELIYDLAQLRYGTVVIEARLDMIVRLSLLELLENSPEEDQILVAQLLAAERFTETLTKMSGTDNLALIRADINRAQPITIANLNAFMDVFSNNIHRILYRLEYEEGRSTGTVAKAKRYARTELCFLLLSIPDISRYVDQRVCQGLKLEAVAPGGPESVTITADVFKRDMNDRACEYREFFRRNKIYETWGIK